MKRTLKQANQRIKELEVSLLMVKQKIHKLLPEFYVRQTDINNYIDLSLDEKWCLQVKKSYEKANKK